MSFELSLLVCIAGAFLLAGFVKGVIGLGLPTISVGLLSLLIAPAQAAALLVVPSVATNIMQIMIGLPLAPLLRRLWLFLVGIVVGTWLGAICLGGPSGGGAAIGLGLALSIYALLGLTSLKLSLTPRHERWVGPLAGMLTGFVTSATGIFVIPSVPYLQALNLQRDQLIQVLGISFLVSTITLAIALFHVGEFPSEIVAGSLLALVPALIGMMVGQRVRSRLPATVFHRCFFLGLFGLGLTLILK